MKIGLVLEGGGMKGSYQLGAYRALTENKIKFNGFVGTSIGAFNAALLASNQISELEDFWNTIDPGTYLEADERLIKAIHSERSEIKSLLLGSLSSIKKWLLNKGIPVELLSDRLENMLDANKLIQSDKDFGLVTVRQKDLKPLYITKENINPEKFKDYIMASCYLPVFKRKKMIDDNYYLDGGFYDNAPVAILLNKDYDKLYVISNSAIGIKQKVSYKQRKKLINITPSRNICGVLELNRNKILENIQLGYYDTLRVIKKYDGYKFTFKRLPNIFYNFISRKISSRRYQRIESFFNTTSRKETIIKALEYVAEKEEIDYYNIYNFYKLLKEINTKNTKKHFINDFVRDLKIF